MALEGIEWSSARDDVERSVTQLLEGYIQEIMSGDEPFRVQHGPYEHESRLPAPAQPPQYDVAFYLVANPRIMWPLEAKILRGDRDLADYLMDLRGQFLTCRYAPFSSEAAMLGYLLRGTPTLVFDGIAKGAPCALEAHPQFPDRPHRISRHSRHVPEGKRYPKEFTCHHLVMLLKPTSSARTAVAPGRARDLLAVGSRDVVHTERPARPKGRRTRR
jgi:hypothetical protein